MLSKLNGIVKVYNRNLYTCSIRFNLTATTSILFNNNNKFTAFPLSSTRTTSRMLQTDPEDPRLPLAKTVLKIDEIIIVDSLTSDTTYNCSRLSDHYHCSCPAWRNYKAPKIRRTCKHLKQLLGDDYETARLALYGGTVTPAAAPRATKKTVTSRSMSTSAKSPAPKASTSKSKSTTNDDANGEEKKVIAVLLAKKFEIEGKKDPTGWWISEKLDGVRAFWDGEGGLWSRLGNKFYAPAWWLRKLPKGQTLDGELFHSRENFNATVSIVRSHASEKWNEIRYLVFDSPSLDSLPFEERQQSLLTSFPPSSVVAPSVKNVNSTRSDYKWVQGPIVDVVEQVRCTGLDHLLKALKEVEAKGGEGLMLREPKSIYVGKRSGTLLKVKTFFDADAEVIGYEPGKGKYVGMTGSLLCRMASNKTFNVGSGLTDSQRSNPPKIGSIISYRFQEMTKEFVPRFPSFLGERIDMIEAKDAVIVGKGMVPGDDDDE